VPLFLEQHGEWALLPSGRVIADEGVQYGCSGAHETMVLPSSDEAYVVIRRADRTCCYVTWQPYSKRWQLLQVDGSWDQSMEVPRAA
jgi:hypothetical protein